MQIIYKQDQQEKFIKRWQEYLDNNTSSYSYLLIILDYKLFCSQNLKKDLSFVVIQNNKCIGIYFLPIEQNKDYMSITIANGYTISPIATKDKTITFIFRNIHKIIKEQDIKIIKFSNYNSIQDFKHNHNTLLKYNFIDASSTTGIVDLRSNTLWTNIRRHYKSMINKVLQNNDFAIHIMDKNNTDYAIHKYYRLLYNKCAGIFTHLKEIFNKQYDIIISGYGTYIGLKYQGQFIAILYFLHFNKSVIYVSGADDPEYTQKKFSIYHPILWKAQEYFKSLKFKYLDFSQPFGYSKVQVLKII
jgi:hypothetical protein